MSQSSAADPQVYVQPVDEHDESFCTNMLPKVSRTFALSITVLPPGLRTAIRIAYLLCRIVDTIEDDAVVRGEEREHLFDVFDELMSDDGSDTRTFERLTAELDLGAGSDDQVLCLGAGSVFRCFRALPLAQRVAVRPHVLEMSRGMREYTHQADARGKLRLRTMADLERYCYFVAGTVGKLLTSLFELEVPDVPPHVLAAARGRAISFGLALQMVNIVKDVATDLPRGDCFLPVELAEQQGIALEAILEEDNRDAGLAILGAVCERAREHLKRAEEYTLAWPVEQGRDVRMFCSVPLTLALATLHEVERGDDSLRPGRTPKVSRDTVLRVFKDSHRAIAANDTLGWMFSFYSSGAYLGEAPSSRRSVAGVSIPPRRCRPPLPPRAWSRSRPVRRRRSASRARRQ